MSVLSLSLVGWIVFTVSGYWLLPDRLRDAWLSGVTLAFLLIHAPLSAAIVLAFAFRHLLLYQIRSCEREKSFHRLCGRGVYPRLL